MSLLQELHTARKARLQRFAEAASRFHTRPVAIAVDVSGEGQVTVRRKRSALPATTLEQIKRQPVRVIQEIVAGDYGLSVSEMLTKTRKDSIVRAKQVAVYLACKITPIGTKTIGRCFGLDHSTVIHSAFRIEQLMGDDPELRERVGRLRCEIQA